jgi:hypothetical protein
VSQGLPASPDETRDIAAYVRAEHVDAVIVDQSQLGTWAPILAPIAHGSEIGGVEVYNVSPSAPDCAGL